MSKRASGQKSVSPPRMRARIIKAAAQENRTPVKKAETTTQLDRRDSFGAEWISPPNELDKLEVLVDESTILPQCIRAYRNNIAGFGFGIQYKDEYKDADETQEMKAEWNTLQGILDLLTLEQDSKEIFENIIEAREKYGIAYLEVIRNLNGMVVQAEFIRDTPSVTTTRPQREYQDVQYFYRGQLITRKKQFRRYKQEVAGSTVYYKEFGDPRTMDYRTGDYVENLEAKYRANELLPFTIGTEAYGKVRWVGQILTVDGARRAEMLNNNYFVNGRHTPLLIAIKGGSLSDESYRKLEEYMDDIKGEKGQHAFIVLETESADNRTGFDNESRPEVEIKDLASILQKDELFQDYLSNGRRKVQSAFQLPDIYVGYTTDFNRATAQTAQEITEQQVFQPERKSLAWTVNNRLLNCYNLKYTEVFFRAPDISNPDDVVKMLNVGERAGALTPNKAKDYITKFFGETSEDYDASWGDIPLEVARVHTNLQLSAATLPTEPQEVVEDRGATSYPTGKNGKQNATQSAQDGAEEQDAVDAQLEKQIAKAQEDGQAQLVPVMKEVRRLLLEMKEKQDEAD